MTMIVFTLELLSLILPRDEDIPFFHRLSQLTP